MRVYLPVTRQDLLSWRDGDQVEVEGFVASSTDEADELAALEAAAAEAPAVAVVEVEDPDAPVPADRLVAVHFDADNSGHLAWYDRSELQSVIDALER